MTLGDIIQALNHPIRRDVIQRLKSGPITAGDLADAYHVSKSTMSTHFAVLKEVDLIEAERDGNVIIYHLNATVAEEAMISIFGLLDTAASINPAKRITTLRQHKAKT